MPFQLFAFCVAMRTDGEPSTLKCGQNPSALTPFDLKPYEPLALFTDVLEHVGYMCSKVCMYAFSLCIRTCIGICTNSCAHGTSYGLPRLYANCRPTRGQLASAEKPAVRSRPVRPWDAGGGTLANSNRVSHVSRKSARNGSSNRDFNVVAPHAKGWLLPGRSRKQTPKFGSHQRESQCRIDRFNQ